MCKAGAGMETTFGKADTPGFPIQEKAAVRHDHRRSQKLFLPRNYKRVNQSSLLLLQSWRGNCDIQLLIYNSDPEHPSISEIARVTNYVVGYACKGNSTLKEEREQCRKMIAR